MRAEDLARAGFDPGVPFLCDTPDALVNAMLGAFRQTARLDLWAHRDPRRGA